ncbi:MAG TPA: amidohydrolase family protein [Labilithrix sp.]|nr:amidohydrolase family protein [Labilithrix sp.]
MRAIAGCAFLLLATVATGCEPPGPALAATARRAPAVVRVRVIRAARLFDVRSGRMIEHPQITITSDGHIESVTAAAQDEPPGGALDLGNVTLLPGLVDAHEHVMAHSAEGYLVMLQKRSEAYRTIEGVAHAHAILQAGYTTVRDCGNEGLQYADVSLRDAIARGIVDGPRLFVATRAIAAVDGYLPLDVPPGVPRPTGAQEIRGADEARRAATEQLARGADLVKLYADFPGSNNVPPRPTLTVEEMRAAIDVAHAAGKKVGAHATSLPGIRNAVAAGVDSIEHGNDADPEILRVMKERGIFLVPTVRVLTEPGPKRAREIAEATSSARLLRDARAAGVKLACGVDGSETDQHGRNALEPITFVELGVPALEALQSATLRGAELLGWDDRIGSVEKGKIADLIAVEGNPLTEIQALSRVVFVMKAGAVVRSARQ